MGARSRLPVAHGPESRHHTTSALCESIGQWFLMDAHCLRLKLGWELACQDRTRQEAESERHKDVTSES
jgi:hypothetical protein